ncbi:MAG: hypothetical protein ABH864_01395 [archaeon]
MLPRWHILIGAALTILIWFFIPSMPIAYLSLIFFSSFLIDFDNYANSVMKRKSLSLKSAFDYHKEMREQEKIDLAAGLRKKGDFHLFHTIEFHALIGLLGLIWIGFFYIFVGMLFHSLLDVSSLLFTGVFHRREFFFFNWLKKKSSKTDHALS